MSGDELIDDRLVAARDEFVRAQAALERACADLRMTLEEVERSTQKGRQHIQRGGASVDLPLAAGLGPLRRVLADRLAEFERTRMTTRTMNVRLAVAEGASASEIARRYGFSRQYAAKLLKDDR